MFETVGLRLLAGEVKWLDREVRSSGGQLMVVFVPFREDVYAASKTSPIVKESDAMVRTLAEACAQSNIPFHDLSPEMRIEGAKGTAALFYSNLDAHPTPAGYRVIADLVSSFVLQHLGSNPQRSAGAPDSH